MQELNDIQRVTNKLHLNWGCGLMQELNDIQPNA